MTAAIEHDVVASGSPSSGLLASAIRVVLIEDGRVDRGSMTDELSKQGFAIRTLSDDASLLDEPDTFLDTDIIVIHCDWPQISGVALLAKLHGQGVDVPVVVLTGEATPAHECLALDNGAVDVICRSRGSEVLGRRLKCVVRASRHTDQPRSRASVICGKLLLRTDVRRAFWNDFDLDLTLGEYNIVHLLASNVGRFVTYRALYDRLRYEGFIAGNGTDGYRANVRSAIKRIRNKFRTCDPVFDEIENYAGFGYCWKKPD